MKESKSPPARLSEQVEVVYQDTLANIMFLKKQQAVGTGFSVLLMAGILVISKAVMLSRGEIAALALLIVVAFVATLLVLDKMQRNLQSFRERLIYINRHFFNDAQRRAMSLRLRRKRLYHDREIIFSLIALDFVAAALVLYFLPRPPL